MADKDASEKALEDLLAGLAAPATPAKAPETGARKPAGSATSRDALGDQMTEVDEMAAGLQELLSSTAITEQVEAVKAEEEAKAYEEKMDLEDIESALATALSTPGAAEGAGAFDEIEEAWEETEPAAMTVLPGEAAPAAPVDMAAIYQAPPTTAVEEVVVVEPEKLSEKRKRFYVKTIMGVGAAVIISVLFFYYLIQPSLRYYYYSRLVKSVEEKRFADADQLLITCEGFGMSNEKDMNLSNIALANRDLPHSLGFARKAFEMSPTNTSAINRIARIYLMQGRIDEADHSARQTLSVDPNNLEARIVQATAYYKKQEISKAQRIVNDVLSMDRNYVPAIELLRDIHVDLKNYPQALILQQQLTVIKKDIPEPQRLMDLGKIYFASSKYTNALSVLNEAYEKDPSLWEAGYFLAKTQVALGQFHQASEQISRTLKEAPAATLDMYYLRALANYQLGNVRTTIEELQRIRVSNPKYAPLYVLMGKIYVYMYGEYATGLKFLEKARELNYADDDFFRTLGDAYFHLNRYREALAVWSRFLAGISPTDPFLFKVSACLMHLNQMEMAQSILAKMWSSGSRSTAIYNNLGVIHELQGRRDMALRFYFLATERAVTQGRRDSIIPKRNFDRLISGHGDLTVNEIDASLLLQS